MGQRFSKSVSIGAGQQFAGTELSARSGKDGKILIVRELLLQMGGEAKDWAIRKRATQPSGNSLDVALLSDTASTDTEVAMRGASADIVLLPGEQVQVVTASATSAMELRVQYEEQDASPEPALRDPKATR